MGSPSRNAGTAVCTLALDSTREHAILDDASRLTGSADETSVCGITAESTDNINGRNTVLNGSGKQVSYNSSTLVYVRIESTRNMQILNGSAYAAEESPYRLSCRSRVIQLVILSVKGSGIDNRCTSNYRTSIVFYISSQHSIHIYSSAIYHTSKQGQIKSTIYFTFIVYHLKGKGQFAHIILNCLFRICSTVLIRNHQKFLQCINLLLLGIIKKSFHDKQHICQLFRLSH